MIDHSADRLPALVDYFLGDLTRRYSSPTVAAYTQALNLFLQHLREHYKLHPTTIAVQDIQMGWGETFLKWMQETRSVETEHLYSRALMQFLGFIARQYELHFDLSALNQTIEAARRIKPHVIPTVPIAALEQIVRLAEGTLPSQGAASEREYLGQLRDRAFLLTLARAGLRISEICSLRCGNYDALGSQLRLPDAYQLPLPQSAVNAINAYLKARAELDRRQPVSSRDQLPLFGRHDKRAGLSILPISRWTGANIVESWVRAALTPDERAQLEVAGQGITPHTFRHYFVLKALTTTDQDVVAAQSIARHGDRSTTRRYLRKITESTAQQ